MRHDLKLPLLHIIPSVAQLALRFVIVGFRAAPARVMSTDVAAIIPVRKLSHATAFIRRAAEKAAAPKGQLRVVGMADLPKLP
ncbi:MAG: hypothetical protein F4Y80_16920 [Caldilineaceae bacterium SB0665_bin_21]|nr:hypothetical protein [Caldilineaceae bacterium SB0665_bin_21]MYA06278.1 hypothetical protein [Caldilineaceae bacterium SB0664_bin_22]MYC64387.1 hypothetical protein [Caldilineaceae bacterium SB0661_bin_34]